MSIIGDSLIVGELRKLNENLERLIAAVERIVPPAPDTELEFGVAIDEAEFQKPKDESEGLRDPSETGVS